MRYIIVSSKFELITTIKKTMNMYIFRFMVTELTTYVKLLFLNCQSLILKFEHF